MAEKVAEKPREVTGKPKAVILHQFRRSSTIPNLSPPCLKLETYLRMANIPYECDFAMKASKKGKVPWIEYNGQAIADSNFCIEFLNKEFCIDVDETLTEEQKGVARAVLVMLEENTYWTLVHYRWCSDYSTEFRDTVFKDYSFPVKAGFFWYFQRKIKNYLYGHGIGRHSNEELYRIAEKDLRAVSAVLGDKKFLFGENPCLVDAALFGLVSNFIWALPKSPQEKLVLSELKNLEDHAKRMKEAYYPDWDELTKRKDDGEESVDSDGNKANQK